MIIAVLLIGGVIYLQRVLTSAGMGADDSEHYHLNDSICNAMSDHDATKKMERYIERWMARNGIKGASLAVMKDEKLSIVKV
jgi:hypothetical protein